METIIELFWVHYALAIARQKPPAENRQITFQGRGNEAHGQQGHGTGQGTRAWERHGEKRHPPECRLCHQSNAHWFLDRVPLVGLQAESNKLCMSSTLLIG